VLDDLKYIHERDAQDALGVAEKQWQQYVHNFDFNWQAPRTINHVVVVGMGGSGLAAKAASSWPGFNVPYEVCQSYDIPRSVTAATLIIFSSYSGNTEETLTVFNSIFSDTPEDVRPMTIVITAGGKLLEQAKKRNIPYIELPGEYQPRMTFGYQLRALVEIFQAAKLCEKMTVELEITAGWLKDQISAWLPTVPANNNNAKKLAQECMGKTPVIYSGPRLFSAAYKWKISLNENAKNVAWCNQLPEFNHNEFLGWTSHPTNKPYTVIDLRSNLENTRVQKRFEISERLLSGKRPAAEIVEIQGDTLVKQLLWAIALGDFVSLYLAILNGLNPTPVDLIEKLKTEMAA
jgi:glucose/mannose-6-phosphate isomerase